MILVNMNIAAGREELLLSSLGVVLNRRHLVPKLRWAIGVKSGHVKIKYMARYKPGTLVFRPL